MSNMALVPALTLEGAVERYNDLGNFVKTILKEGLDYGVIPGTNKPTLFKPGAEKLCSLFGMVPVFSEIEAVEDWTGKDHNGEPFFYYKIRCQLVKDGKVMSDCIASCNSWETRYRYRNAGKSCPICGKDAIIKGKLEYGGGYICFTKKGGCGTKFADSDERIKSQTEGKVPNAEIFDQVNTLVKQAAKRAMVGACLIGANASEYFTQDMEDIIIQGDWKEVPDEQQKEKPVSKPSNAPRNPAPAAAATRPAPSTEELPIDDWQPPTEEVEAPKAKVTESTPWEENGIVYRKSDRGLLLKFGPDWKPVIETAVLSSGAIKSIKDLFKNDFELEGHLFKHFKVKTLSSLNWQQVMALLNFKKKNIVHPIYYADKEPVAEKPAVSGAPNSELRDFFDPKKKISQEVMGTFLEEATKLPDPKSLQALFDAGLSLEAHSDSLVNIVSIVASGDYPLLDDDGKLSPQVRELVDYAKSSAS